MSFQGDMTSKMKSNKTLRDINRSHYSDFKKPFLKYKKSLLKTKHIGITEQEREEIRIKTIDRNKQRERNARFITIISIIILLILIIWGMNKINSIDYRFRF